MHSMRRIATAALLGVSLSSLGGLVVATIGASPASAEGVCPKGFAESGTFNGFMACARGKLVIFVEQ